MDETQFLETWDIHNRINLYLLDGVEATALASLSASKGRNVGEQFAHLHNVRLMWLKPAAPDLLRGLEKIEKTDAQDKQLLRQSLADSGEAIKTLLSQSFAAGGKVKNFKPHALAFLGYLISHESHHRGQIMLSLKQAGHPVDKKIQYGIWEWGVAVGSLFLFAPGLPNEERGCQDRKAQQYQQQEADQQQLSFGGFVHLLESRDKSNWATEACPAARDRQSQSPARAESSGCKKMVATFCTPGSAGAPES